MSVADAVAPRAAFAADALGHVSAPLRFKGTDDGLEYEKKYTAEFRKNSPSSQEPGTRYLGLDDDDSVPA